MKLVKIRSRNTRYTRILANAKRTKIKKIMLFPLKGAVRTAMRVNCAFAHGEVKDRYSGTGENEFPACFVHVFIRYSRSWNVDLGNSTREGNGLQARKRYLFHSKRRPISTNAKSAKMASVAKPPFFRRPQSDQPSYYDSYHISMTCPQTYDDRYFFKF